MLTRYSFAGGEGGIRTHGALADTAVFKTADFNHSPTSPHDDEGEDNPPPQNGAEDGIRTRDPRLGKAMLYP